MKKCIFSLLCFLLVGLVPVMAQDERPAPVPEAVEVEASDGLILKGDLYRPENPAPNGQPALLLFHELEQTRVVYNKIIPDFLDAGYVVLNVDLRGHGETGGASDWTLAQSDTQTWLAWLREQESVRDESVGIIGASVGSVTALVGCAQDPACATVIALSPVSRFPEFDLTTAIETQLSDRSVLLIAGHIDRGSADTVRTLFTDATGEVSAYLFPGGAHGTGFLGIKRDREATMAVIMAWLAQELPVPLPE